MLAVAALGPLAVGVFGQVLATETASLDLAAETRAALLAEVPRLAQTRLPEGIGAELRDPLRQAIVDAFLASFRVTMALAAGMALLGSVCAAFTVGRDRSREDG